MNNLAKVILFIVVAIGLVWVWKTSEPRMKQVNKYQCAVYGYYEDCKTPLPEELRLK